MSANLRFSSNTVSGKKYLGGTPITGSIGVFSPSFITTGGVFDDILKSENIAGTEDYRCIYLQNDFASQVIYAPTIKITASQPTNAIFTMGLLSDKNVVAEPIASETTAPTGIIFNATTTQTPLIVGATDLLDPGEYVGFWIKRKAVNTGGSGTITGEMSFQIEYST